MWDAFRSKQQFEDAAQSVQENTVPEPEAAAQVQETRTMEFAPIQVDFSELQRYYPDVNGWLYCDGTNINYPLVQTDNNQYYMYRLPSGEESAGGSLFVDCTNAWDFSDSNTVIYGHDMKNGTMFGYLHNFDQQSYYENHPIFYLLTPSRNYRMDIFCTAVVPSDSWIYQKQMDEDQLDKWIQKAEQTSLIQPLSAAHREAEHFLTLSTCSYEYGNARFVVIGSLTQVW